MIYVKKFLVIIFLCKRSNLYIRIFMKGTRIVNISNGLTIVFVTMGFLYRLFSGIFKNPNNDLEKNSLFDAHHIVIFRHYQRHRNSRYPFSVFSNFILLI